MSLRLALLERHLPGPIRRRMLQRLVAGTADAFGAPRPTLPDPRDAAFIRAFAEFTRDRAAGLGDDGPATAAARARLYAAALELGRSIRRWAGVRTAEDSARALRLVYDAIGIGLRADLETGAVTVRRCAFSDTYTPSVCHLVSALDAGVFRGVTGAWNVTFVERITDGSATCRGHLAKEWIP